MKIISGCLAALVATGCAAPASDPGSNLATRGVTVVNTVDGDSGCPGLGFDDQSARYDVTISGDGRVYSVFVTRWLDLESFAADGTQDTGSGSHPARPYNECITAYQGVVGRPISRVDAYPWRAFGPEWPDALRQAVLDSISDGSGG